MKIYREEEYTRFFFVGEMNTELYIYFCECCNGGPRPTSERDFPPQLEVPSSSVQGHLLETPTLESYHCFSFVCYTCFFVLVYSGSRSIKFGLAELVNTLPLDAYG